MPSHASREVLIVLGSLSTCDPGDIGETIKVSLCYSHSTIQYNTEICNARNVCELSASEARAVTGGWWHTAGLKGSSRIICFFKLRSNEPIDGEMGMFSGLTFDICGAA